MKEVAGDVTHSLLHLDSRVWQTIKLLVRRPGELTREFIAGRHQQYLPPFRLYLASASSSSRSGAAAGLGVLRCRQDATDTTATAPTSDGRARKTPGPRYALPEDLRKELEAEGVTQSKDGNSILSGEDCNINVLDGDAARRPSRSRSRAPAGR